MRRSAAFALVAFLLTACEGGLLGGGGTPSALLNETGVGQRSTFAVATPVGLLGLDAAGKVLGHIVALPPGAVPSGVALDPNGKTIFFALSETKPGLGFGSDIYSVNLDASDLRPVITRDQANVFYASPSLDGSGNLYVHRRAAKEDPEHPGVYLETSDAIERIDLRTGERRKVVDDGAEPNVAPGGKTLVFVHLDRGQQAGLWTSSTDGARPEPLLRTGDRFWWLQSPRISPTGRELTWSSAGRSATAPSIIARAGGAARLAHLEIPFELSVAPLDGTRLRSLASAVGGARLGHLEIPSELYVAPLDGTSLRSIALTRDDVVPAWSPDGTKIAYVALATFYVVAASNGEVIVHTEGIGFNYGDLIWLPR